jgi:hypothetical protein
VPADTHIGNRTATQVDTGLRFLPHTPVMVRVTRREHRIDVSDDGAAIDLAGHPHGWRDAARRIGQEFVVNVSRRGVVSLPVVPAGPSEAEIVKRIGQASLAFYQELLELSR